jgi:FlaA1/EpsC-like NDP-sugar epimerase
MARGPIKTRMDAKLPFTRPYIGPDSAVVDQYIKGKKVLVTGAGGSIGAELCRQIAEGGPERLIMLGRGENSIFEIYEELAQQHDRRGLAAVIVDVRDRCQLERLFAAIRPDVVFHTAAHKHVHLMEDNPEEAVKNNVFGTLNTAQVARDCGVSTFVLISSDKAVNPSSVYGATKKAAEYIVLDMARTGKGKFIVVRFGNVIRSRGSIIPIFERQIRNGGPITLTDPRMERFFMSIPEAAYLVMQSGGVARSGQVCVLDMGTAVKVVDLAHHLIEEAGLQVGKDIKIEVTGVKPGEKIVEELVVAGKALQPTQWEKIMLDEPELMDSVELGAALGALRKDAITGDRDAVIAGLKRLVPTYVPG